MLKTIKCTPKQYELLRAIILTLPRRLRTSDSCLPRSKRDKTLSLTLSRHQVLLLSHMEDQFNVK